MKSLIRLLLMRLRSPPVPARPACAFYGHPTSGQRADPSTGVENAREHSGRYCQVDEKLVDQPPRYGARASREPAMLGVKNGTVKLMAVGDLVFRGARKVRLMADHSCGLSMVETEQSIQELTLPVTGSS